MIARSVLFRPGGPLACELARHAVVLKVNDWLFCHGGLLPRHGITDSDILITWIFHIISTCTHVRSFVSPCLKCLIGVLVLHSCIWHREDEQGSIRLDERS